LLIDANVGLARKMLASGQISDARQVLDHLKTLASPARLREIELELAVQAGGTEEALPKLIAALTDPAAPLTNAERVKVA